MHILREEIMGCLKKILINILLIALVVIFFTCGGYKFVKDKIKEYKYPTREAFVESEKKYADFSDVSANYQLYRSFNLFGYKKINAKYIPTEQKITIFDLKNEDWISEADFMTSEINEKINTLLDKLKDSLITYENFEIVKKGYYQAKGRQIPYLVYKTNIKNIPFKEIMGTLCVYETVDQDQNRSTKIIFSTVNEKAYNPIIMKDFVTSLRFE